MYEELHGRKRFVRTTAEIWSLVHLFFAPDRFELNERMKIASVLMIGRDEDGHMI